MPRPKKPTPRQALRIFERKIHGMLAKYRRTLEAAQDHPQLSTYWRNGYEIKKHWVKGHWVIRARAKKEGGK